MKPLYKSALAIDIPSVTRPPEATLKLRHLAVPLLGALGGLVAACITRRLFDLPIDRASLAAAKFGLIVAGIGGLLVLLIPATLMTQARPEIPRRSVFIVCLITAGVLGVVGSSGLLLIIRFVNSGFFQNRGLDVVLKAVGVSAGLAAGLFLLVAPLLGHGRAAPAAADPGLVPARRSGSAGAKGAAKAAPGVVLLRRCPSCGTLNIKGYPATDPDAVAKGLKRYVCDRGHEWHA